MISVKQTKAELQLTNGIEFLASGVAKMKEHAELLVIHHKGAENKIMPLTGTLCVGTANMAQGFELVLKAALAKANLKDSGLKQHAFFSRFERVAEALDGFDDLKSQEENQNWVQETLEKLETQFMTARYFGQGGKDNLDTVRPDVLLRITFWVIHKTYPHWMEYGCARMDIPISTKANAE